MGSSCSGCTWSAQQRLRQSRRWALAESVHGSPGECGNTFQPQDHNVATVDGNVDLSHHPHADKTERREDVTATTLPQDETKRSGSSETIGRNFECLTELEPLVQQVAVALEERCGVHGGDQVSRGHPCYNTQEETGSMYYVPRRTSNLNAIICTCRLSDPVYE